MRHASLIVATLVLSLGSLTAQSRTIVETAVASEDFDTLVAAVKAADLVETLSGKGLFTVFAPTDAAFANLPKGTLETLLKPENKGRLTDILTFHVVPGSLPAKKVLGAKHLTTVQGQRALIAMDGDTATIGGAAIVKTDIHCSNGIIHVIDSVILPSSKNLVEVAQEAGSFNTLLKAATEAGLAPALMNKGPFTVFAPSDAAFAKLPDGTLSSLLEPQNREKLASILKAHVVEGRVYSDQAMKLSSAPTIGGYEVPVSRMEKGLKVGGARVVATDIQAANGVIHVIDSVIIPKSK